MAPLFPLSYHPHHIRTNQPDSAENGWTDAPARATHGRSGKGYTGGRLPFRFPPVSTNYNSTVLSQIQYKIPNQIIPFFDFSIK